MNALFFILNYLKEFFSYICFDFFSIVGSCVKFYIKLIEVVTVSHVCKEKKTEKLKSTG